MGPFLRMLQKVLGKAAVSSEGSPKTANSLGLLGLAGSVWAMLGFNPVVVHQLGEMMIRLGDLLVKF